MCVNACARAHVLAGGPLAIFGSTWPPTLFTTCVTIDELVGKRQTSYKVRKREIFVDNTSELSFIV